MYLISFKKHCVTIIRKLAILKKRFYKKYVKYVKELDYKEIKRKKNANKV